VCSSDLLDAQAASRIEQSVRDAIAKDLVVHTQDAPLSDAKAVSALRAVFGEVYPDPVRVVSVGPSVDELLMNPDDAKWSQYSIEFCGGTHLARTSEAQAFALMNEEGVAKGIRRVTAMTGDDAKKAMEDAEKLAARLRGAATLDDAYLSAEAGEINKALEEATIPLVKKFELRDALESLRTRVKKAEKAASSVGRDRAVEAARELEPIAGMPAVLAEIEAGGDRDALLAAMDAVRARHEDAAAMLVSVDHDGGKVVIVAKVPESLIGKGFKAGDWVRVAAQACGGKGGGRPDSAQGGGTEPAKSGDAIEAARAYALEKLV